MKTNKMNNEKCPNCGSYATNKHGLGVLAASLLMTSGILMWIPILGWICLPFTLAGSLICGVLAPFSKSVGCTCNTCKYQWNIEKSKNK